MKRRDLLKSAPAALLAAGTGALVPLRARAAEGGLQVLGAQRFQVGEMLVTSILDGFLTLPPDVLQGTTPDEVATLLENAYQDPSQPRGSINAFIIETGGETWLVDSGAGGYFGPNAGHLPDILAALGIDPASVRKLLLTHLHADHTGGATVDASLATFPNAELVVTEADRAFWTSEEIQAQAHDMMKPNFDLSRATIAAYGDRVTVIEGEAEAAPGITARPLPGHTPGHTGYHVESGGESLLIWADIVHVPAVQFARPEVTIPFDVDQQLAAATRADLMASLADSGQRIAGMHLTFPGTGYVERAGEGYRFVPAPWEYL
ncbi:MBL fold metallo-hydrolase [Tropicimonas marinistellae]|uniref:MBL fold metallo-hydrolase n=1 Tax=Tropicimonas marinistellae TaxID=1739787 RepID=UPI00082C2A24|nr:MBL fold metallo-hydrolase [Tropicimonas marinistellae]